MHISKEVCIIAIHNIHLESYQQIKVRVVRIQQNKTLQGRRRMNFREFINVVKKEIKNQLPSGVTLSICGAKKNNAVEKSGLMFAQGNEELSQTIYLEEYYQRFQKEEDLTAIVDSLLKCYENIRVPSIVRIEDFAEYSKIKDKIVYRLINAKKNQELLEGVPHETFLDLAIVYYVLVAVGEGKSEVILIREKQRKAWGVTIRNLQESAQANTEKSADVEFRNMNEVMQELMGEEEEDGIKEEPMYVLTNRMRIYGASTLLYDGIFERIAKEMKGAFYVLPSSIHEVIIVPEMEGVKLVELKDMVVEINRTQVAPDEVLSNNVYYYNPAEKKELIIM